MFIYGLCLIREASRLNAHTLAFANQQCQVSLAYRDGLMIARRNLHRSCFPILVGYHNLCRTLLYGDNNDKVVFFMHRYTGNPFISNLYFVWCRSVLDVYVL